MDTEEYEKSLELWVSENEGTLPQVHQYPSWLVYGLQYLLENRFADLLQLLYRRDISEEKVKAVFSGNETGDIAVELARLFVEREALRQRIRKRYSSGESPTSLPPIV